MFPDLVLTAADRGKRLEGVIEVETGESVNHLEAMAQRAHFGRMRVPFHLYVPAAAVDIAKRLCTENQVHVAEIWTYHTIGDQTRFTLIQKDAQRDVTQNAMRDTPRHEERDGAATPAAEDVRHQRSAPRTAPPSRTAPASSRGGAGHPGPPGSSSGGAARNSARPARGANPRASRAKPPARKTARTQKRK